MNQSKLSPEVEVLATPQQTAVRVAEIIADVVGERPDAVLGLATGSTPVEVYRELIRMHREDGLDFSRVTTFNLDEYVGLGPGHEQSYRQFMNATLFSHINIDPSRTHVPSGVATEIDTHAIEYESLIRAAGGIDLQLLGIGSNGHIAFNEPGSPADCRTRKVDLTAETIEANSRFFDSLNEVPRHAITMGIATILEARRILLMATGAGKAEAVRGAINGPIVASLPASQLQRSERVTFILDQAAAELLGSQSSPS